MYKPCFLEKRITPALEALDRIDETVGLVRSCLNDPPELIAMNAESFKADMDGILKDLRKHGAIIREGLHCLENFSTMPALTGKQLIQLMDKIDHFEVDNENDLQMLIDVLIPAYCEVLGE